MSANLRRCFSLLAFIISLAMPLGVLAHGDEEHGDHDAHHGGYVMMYQDIHFEIVPAPEGGVRIYYTDAARADLPAATVSDVAVEIERAGQVEYVSMAISAGGDFWEGASKPATSPDDIVRVGFVFQGEPLLLDLPASSFPALAEKDSGHAAHMEHGDSHAGH